MNKPTLETIKEVGRWVVSGLAAWLITETLAQITAVPESQTIHIWVFAYTIPIRTGVQTLLTLAGRAIDKYVFTASKEDPDRKKTEDPKGVIPF